MRVYTRINLLIRYIGRFNYFYATYYNGLIGRPEGSNPSLSANFNRCIPETWFTLYTGDIVNTLSPAKGLGAGSTRPFSLSKNPRS